MAQRQERHTFASLHWYREVVSFLFTFAAITSEVLLGAGLTISTVNFLTDGNMMGDNSLLANAWAWAQALAIDSGLGVTFASVFVSIKQRDWIKVCCYCLLTTILAVVAGAITDIDTLSHALHIATASAITQVGLNVKALTIFRSIAVVGFVLMSRLKEISFKDLYEVPSAPASPSQRRETPAETERTTTLVRKLIAEAFAQQEKAMFLETQETLPLSIPQVTEKASQQQAETTRDQSGQEDQEEQQDDSERDAKLERTYRELEAEGKRVSGRALAARAHVRRSTCSQWLAMYHPETSNDDKEEELEHE